MDLTTILSWLPTIMKFVDSAASIRQTIRQGGSVDTILSGVIPDLAPILRAVGEQFFPKVAAKLAPAAALDMIFDKDGTTWVQNSLNLLGQTPPLTVDGVYGKITKAAVEAYQTKNNLKVDGWAGPKTSGALAVAISKLPVA